MCLIGALSYEVLGFRFNVFHGEYSYSLLRFLEVPVKSGIIMLFVPASILHDFFALSANFSLNIFKYFDSPSKNYGCLRMALLKSLMLVVEV